jgi:hypothetical protein
MAIRQLSQLLGAGFYCNEDCSSHNWVNLTRYKYDFRVHGQLRQIYDSSASYRDNCQVQRQLCQLKE